VFFDEVSIDLVMACLYGWGDKRGGVEDCVFVACFDCVFVFVMVCLLGVNVSVVFRGVLSGCFLFCV
jgi:hypothetical protein